MIFKRNPSAFLAMIQAFLSLAIGFGLSVTTEQFSLIMAATSTAVGFITHTYTTADAKLADTETETVDIDGAC